MIKENKLPILILMISLIMVGVLAFLSSKLTTDSEVEADENVELVVGSTSHNWGEIDINGGEVEKTFEIKNEGTSDLSLTDVNTSCMCTTAKLVSDGRESPEFGMHSKSRYVMSIGPGYTARLVVVFDPAYHGPSGVGPITRQVEISTNDPTNPKLVFQLSAMVKS